MLEYSVFSLFNIIYFCLVPIASVMGLQGTTGVLPCDVMAASGPDDVFLILWFKDNATKPMYR